MATIVQSAYGIVDATSPLTLALPSSATAGNMVLLVLSYVDFGGAGAALATPTDANGTYQAVFNPGYGSNVSGMAVFYVPNCSSGTHSTDIEGASAAPDGNFFCTGAIYEISGLTTTPLDKVSAGVNNTSGFGTSQATGTTGTLSQANEWAIVWAGFDDNPGVTNEGVTVPSTYTVDPNIPSSFQNTLNNLGLQFGFKEISATTALNPSFTYPSQPTLTSMVTGIATFEETAGGAAPFIPLPMVDTPRTRYNNPVMLQPNLSTTTLASGPAAPSITIRRQIDSAPKGKFPVQVDVYPNTVLRGIPSPPAPPVNIRSLTDSAPRAKFQIQVDNYPNTVLRGIPNPPTPPPVNIRSLTESAPRSKYQVQVDVYPNIALTTPAVVQLPPGVQAQPSFFPKYNIRFDIPSNQLVLGYPSPPTPPVTILGLTNSAPAVAKQLQPDIYPNIVLLQTPPATPPITVRSLTESAPANRNIPGADIPQNMLALLSSAAPTLPPGAQLFDSAPRSKSSVQSDIGYNFVLTVPASIPPGLPLGIPLDTNQPKLKFALPAPDVYPNTVLLGIPTPVVPTNVTIDYFVGNVGTLMSR